MAFTISFPLILEPWQKDYLNKKLYIMARYYNELAFELNKRLDNLKRDEEYIAEVQRIKYLDETEACKKRLFGKNKRDFIIKYNATPEGVRKTLGMELLRKKPQYQNHLLTSEINTTIVRGSLNKAYKSGKIHYKRKNEGLHSFESQIPAGGGGSIKVNPVTREVEMGSPNVAKIIKAKFKVHKNDQYAYDVLEQIKQNRNGWITNESSGLVRLKRKQRKNKDYYYIEIILKDNIIKPKTHKPVAKGNRVGVDIGATTVAWFDGQNTEQVQLGSSIELIQNSKRKQRILQRKLDRQRRANNPNNYNEDGTINKGKKVWVKSNNYKKTQGQLQDISHKISTQRRELLNMIANQIIESGDHILIEQMNWKELTKNEEAIIHPDTGRYMSSKRFGKLVGENAPATLIELLKNKLNCIEGIYEEVNTYDTALSQFNHVTGERIKKDLSQRETEVDGYLVGRDTYSALLIRNVDTTKKKHEVKVEKVKEDWHNFIESEKYRYKEIESRLEQGEKLPNAMIPNSLLR